MNSRRSEMGAAALDTSGRSIVGPLLPERLGHTAHELIAAALARNPQPTSGRELIALWRDLGLGRGELTYQQVERQVAVSRADSYFHYHAPDPSWTSLGSEYQLPGDNGEPRHVDHAWQTLEELVLLDEWKTGRMSDMTLLTLGPQLERYRRLANQAFGERFLGIRACLLFAPERSFWMRPDGTCLPLREWQP